MPNWVMTTLTVDGPTDDFYKFHNAVPAFANPDDKEAETSILKSFIPEPEDEDTDWYEWQVNNWGVKWGDCRTWCDELFHTDDHEYTTGVYKFDTPWHFAIIGFITVSSLNPTLRFQFEMREEGGFFAGFIVMRAGLVRFAHSFSDDEYDGPMETEDDWDKFDEWKRGIMGELCDLAEKHGWEGMEERQPSPFGYGPDDRGPF